MLRPLLVCSFLLCVLLACGRTDHAQGHALYDEHCGGCHGEDGKGLRQLIPPLAGADYLVDHPDRVVRGIRQGMNGPMVVNGITYNHPMPGNKELSAIQIVNIVNYIHQAWGNAYPPINAKQARAWLEGEGVE